METKTTNAPICKTQICQRPLTFLEDSKCWRCLVCNPLNKQSMVTEQPERKYVDVAMTDERVREIVRDELENWHIQKPPVTRDEINTSTNNVPTKVPTLGEQYVQEILDEQKKPETWRQKARRMGVKTHNDYSGGARKKVDVLAEVAAKERTKDGRVGNTEDQSGS